MNKPFLSLERKSFSKLTCKTELAETTRLWVCRLLIKSQIFGTKLDVYQRFEPKSGVQMLLAHPISLLLQKYEILEILLLKKFHDKVFPLLC